MRTIYPCSKVHHRKWWLDAAKHFPIKATWLTVEPMTPEGFRDLWALIIPEAAASHMVAYAEPGETLKGALVEVGACLAGGGTVFVVGDPDGLKTAKHHPNVRLYPIGELHEALKDAARLCRSEAA